MNVNPEKTELETLDELSRSGYTALFIFKDGKLKCPKSGKVYTSKDVVIDEQFRFEGMTNPSDSSILFALSCHDGTKGVIVSGYGIYADYNLLKFIDELETRVYESESEVNPAK